MPLKVENSITCLRGRLAGALRSPIPGMSRLTHLRTGALDQLIAKVLLGRVERHQANQVDDSDRQSRRHIEQNYKISFSLVTVMPPTLVVVVRAWPFRMFVHAIARVPAP
jgi:hypothetical protein